MRQYRSELRKPIKETAHLSWEIGAGYVRTAKATAQDISSSGMGLLVATPLAVDTKLQITAAGKAYTAFVRRCIKQNAQYLLGVKFER